VTARAVVFVLLLLGVLAVAFGGITYYGRHGFYVGFRGDDVAVFQGERNGLLWLHPTVEQTYPLRRQDLSPDWQQKIADTRSFTSRTAADLFVQTLASNPAAVPALATTTTPVPPTTTTIPTTVPTTPPPTPAPTSAPTPAPAVPAAPPAT
jgi:hypothetical protein